MKKISKTQSQAKASRCEKLLNNKDLSGAFDNVRAALHNQYDEIKTSDIESMIRIKERLHLLKSVEDNLKQAIRDGRLVQFQVEQEELPPYLGDIVEWRKRHQQ